MPSGRARRKKAAEGEGATGGGAGSSSSSGGLVAGSSSTPNARQSGYELASTSRAGIMSPVQERADSRARSAGSALAYSMRRDASDHEKLRASMALADYVNTAFGHDAAALGRHLRESSQIAMVLGMLYESEPQIHHYGLMILANLVSDAFDPLSVETKTLVHRAGIFDRLKDFLFAGDEVAQTCACAVLQNLCVDVRFANAVRQYELTEELEHFVQVSTNHKLRRYAAGALHNAMESLQAAFQANSIENRESGGARGIGVLSRVMSTGATDPEFEVSEEVMEIISAHAAENAEKKALAEEAVQLIQSAVRRKKGEQMWTRLMAFIRCSRVVAKCVRRWRRRRR